MSKGVGYRHLHAFLYKEPTSRPSSKSSLFVDLKSANCSTKSSLIVPYFSNAIKIVQKQEKHKILNIAVTGD